MSHVWLALRLTLAGVFLVAGLAKVRSFPDAAAMSSQLLERIGPAARRWARPVTGLLIVVETTTGIAMLIAGPVYVAALLAAGLLLVIVTVLALLSAGRAIDLRCACFGRATARLGWRHVWRNLVLLAIVVAGLSAAVRDTPEQWNTGGIVVAAGTAVLATIVAMFYDDIVDFLTDADRATS